MEGDGGYISYTYQLWEGAGREGGERMSYY
jgi:hypothetical protein